MGSGRVVGNSMLKDREKGHGFPESDVEVVASVFVAASRAV